LRGIDVVVAKGGGDPELMWVFILFFYEDFVGWVCCLCKLFCKWTMAVYKFRSYYSCYMLL